MASVLLPRTTKGGVMRWPGLFLTKRGHGVPADMAPWAAILSLAVLFVGWEFLTHYYGHRFITANRVSFAVIVILVGLIGSFFTWFTFIYLERISREGASVVPGELRGETSLWLREDILFGLQQRLPGIHPDA